MEFRFNAEQELFRQTVREYCEAEVWPRSREIDEKEAGIPDEIIQGLVDLGVYGVTIPEEYGGAGVPEGEEMVYAMIAVHEIGRAELSMSLPVYTLLNLGWSYLVALKGTEELKRELLPKVASGEWFVGICTTEPGGGSDVANIKTSAKQVGDKFVINGEKAYISGVTESTQRGGGLLTLFRTDPEKGHRGMTFAYVPTNAEGISTTVYKDMGRMGLSTGGLVYKDVEIPTKYVIGEIDRGFYANMEGFNAARILVSAACLGGAEKCLEIGRDYVQQRVLFGRPLAKFEGISFEIAEDYAKLEQLKLILTKAAWMTGQYYTQEDHGGFTIPDLNRTVSICKMLAPHLTVDVAKHAMMYLGAFGYTKDSPLEMCMRGAMSYVVGAEGGTNIQKLIIARDYIGDVAVPYR